MSIEAMKQALEALDIGLEYAESELYENRRRYEGYMHLAPNDQAYVNQIKEAITSLRQAIEQAEKQEPVAYQNTQEKCRIETVPAQGGLLPTMQEGKDFTITHPQPQREWVGLTDEQIDQGLCRTPYAMKTAEAWREGVRWAYHQIKEKNT
jgi:hypothetical protein